jgi:hypothetical protein
MQTTSIKLPDLTIRAAGGSAAGTDFSRDFGRFAPAERDGESFPELFDVAKKSPDYAQRTSGQTTDEPSVMPKNQPAGDEGAHDLTDDAQSLPSDDEPVIAIPDDVGDAGDPAADDLDGHVTDRGSVPNPHERPTADAPPSGMTRHQVGVEGAAPSINQTDSKRGLEPSPGMTAHSNVPDDGDDDTDGDEDNGENARVRHFRVNAPPADVLSKPAEAERDGQVRTPERVTADVVASPMQTPVRGADVMRHESEQASRREVEPVKPPHLAPAEVKGQPQQAKEVNEFRHDRMMPAASRAEQLEAQIRLENATGQPAATDGSSRIAAVPTGANGSSLNGEQNGQNLPGQNAGNADRAIPDESRFTGRVVRGLTAMLNSRGGTMTMRLDPPELGQLRVQMTLARGTVSASFIAQTPQAHALLEKNLAALRIALESQGLTVERLSVQSQQSSNQQGHLMNDDGTNRQQEQQRQDAAGGESRGRREKPNDGSAAAHSNTDGFADVIEQLEQTQEFRH